MLFITVGVIFYTRANDRFRPRAALTAASSSATDGRTDALFWECRPVIVVCADESFDGLICSWPEIRMTRTAVSIGAQIKRDITPRSTQTASRLDELLARVRSTAIAHVPITYVYWLLCYCRKHDDRRWWWWWRWWWWRMRWDDDNCNSSPWPMYRGRVTGTSRVPCGSPCERCDKP